MENLAFVYKNGELYCEDVPLKSIVEACGTPCFVYSYSSIVEGVKKYLNALSWCDGIVCFAVKANSNLSVLRAAFRAGAGADIVSGGELFRALRAGVDPGKVVFAGVGKTPSEMEYALRAGIMMFNVESEQELEVLNDVAKTCGLKAPVAIRVNPDVDPKTHPYIATGLKESKFGVDIQDSIKLYEKAASLSNIDVVGVHCHIGSQITQIEPFVEAAYRVFSLCDKLSEKGINLKFFDIGGGLGIRYKDEKVPDPEDLFKLIKPEFEKRNLTAVVEPGRSIIGNAGVLLTSVIYVKHKGDKVFFVVDAAMNDLPRPSLYNAYHEIVPVVKTDRAKVVADVVGPICETGDFLAKSRELPEFEAGEIMAVMSAGAYCFSMSSNYNSRVRACEVMVNKDQFYIVRDRETYEDLILREKIAEFLL